MYRTIGHLASLEALGFWGFIIASRHYEGTITRFGPLLVLFFSVGFIGYLKAKFFSYIEISYISVVVSAIFVLTYLILGFSLYPGLVKDTALFSTKTLSGTIVMLSGGTAGHFFLLSLARVVRR